MVGLGLYIDDPRIGVEPRRYGIEVERKVKVLVTLITLLKFKELPCSWLPWCPTRFSRIGLDGLDMD